MDILVKRRVRVLFFLFHSLFLNGAAAATLVVFDFDDESGNFEITPEFTDTAISDALWSDDLGLLADFAGNPGRALATSGFPAGNALHLALILQPGFEITIDRIRFDLRASASGPGLWQIAAAGFTLASGVVTTSFDTYEAVIALLPAQQSLTLDLETQGASSSAGTLRIDNVELIGSLTPVTLPAAVYLFATPLLAFGLRSRSLDGPQRNPGIFHRRS